MTRFTIFIFLFSSFLLKESIAQKLVPFEIKFKVNLPTDTSIKIETLKFYISDLKISNKNSIVFEEKNFYKLVDISNDTVATITSQVPSNLLFNKISFNLGIDSNTNKTGIQGGELDPSQGMYWSWQSGYINFKLEGTSPKCNTRKNKFQFHLGGFLEGQYALQTFEFPAKSKNNLLLTIDLNTFFNSVDLTKINTVMIPGKEAIEIAQRVKLTIND